MREEDIEEYNKFEAGVVTAGNGIKRRLRLFARADVAEQLNTIFSSEKMDEILPEDWMPAWQKMAKWNATAKMILVSMSMMHARSFLGSYYFGGAGTFDLFGLNFVKAYKHGVDLINESKENDNLLLHDVVRGGVPDESSLRALAEEIGNETGRTPSLVDLARDLHKGPILPEGFKDDIIKGQQAAVLSFLRMHGLNLFERNDWDQDKAYSANVVSEFLDKFEPSKKAKDYLVNLHRRYSDWLFSDFGAGLKALTAVTDFVHQVDQEKERLGRDLTWEEFNDVGREIASHMRSDFGNLHHGRDWQMFGIDNPMMSRKRWKQQVFSMINRAPDWNESNLRPILALGKDLKGKTMAGRIARGFILRSAYRVAVLTVALNLLATAFEPGEDEDEDYLDRLHKRAKRAWDKGHLRWLYWDVTPFYHALGGKKKVAYMSVGGHFLDPLRVIPDLSRMPEWPFDITEAPLQFILQSNPARMFYYKSSKAFEMLADAATGTDWTGRNEFTKGLNWEFTQPAPPVIKNTGMRDTMNYLASFFAMSLPAGKVRKVYDGKSFEASIDGGPVRIRIRGIGNTGNERIDLVARKYIQDKIASTDKIKLVGIEHTDRGVYANVFINGDDLGKKMIANGLAFDSRGDFKNKYPDDISEVRRANEELRYKGSLADYLVNRRSDWIYERASTLPSFTLYHAKRMLPIPASLFMESLDPDSSTDFIEAVSSLTGTPITAADR